MVFISFAVILGICFFDFSETAYVILLIGFRLISLGYA